MARGAAGTREEKATLGSRSPLQAPARQLGPPAALPVPSPRRDAPGLPTSAAGAVGLPAAGSRGLGAAGERAGEGPGRAGAGARGSRGAGSPGTAARRPAAPPHLQLRQGRWPRRPGRAGMS